MSHNLLNKMIQIIVKIMNVTSNKTGTMKMTGFERIVSHASYNIMLEMKKKQNVCILLL